MTADVTIFAALIAGLVSFLSPCVLPLVPPYLVYLAGTSLERFADEEPEPRVKRETVAAALLFVPASPPCSSRSARAPASIGSLIRAYSGPLAIVAGIVIIVMGLHFLGLTPIALLMREKRLDARQAGRAVGRLRDGARLRVRLDAVHRADPRRHPGGRGLRADGGKGAGLLAVYSLGLGIPFMVAAFAIEPFAAFLARFKNYLHRVEQAMGALLVLTGIAFLTGSVNQMSVWLLETFPALGKIG